MGYIRKATIDIIRRLIVQFSNTVPKNSFTLRITLFLLKIKNEMKSKFSRICVVFFTTLTLFNCKNNSSENTTSNSETTDNKVNSTPIKAPEFNSDSAFAYVEKQVNFGPRVPGTAAHKKCGDWLSNKFKSMGLEVINQNFTAITYDNKSIPARNIIASFNPKATKRIILSSHWDSRPFADKDPSNKTGAIDGANDGASGVGVMIEIARQLTGDSSMSNLGVDFILFDAEDWGAPESYTKEVKHPYGGYCLGSEYWSKNLHKLNYTAFYGILLDMVGAKDATFRHEGVSMQVAPSVVNSIWANAAELGFSQFFVSQEGGSLTDDHVPVIQNAKIPMIDIIDLRPTENTFFEHHHTHGDNIDTIDKTTLSAVGKTLMFTFLKENANL
jgi:glutaminyl-peptide cyclotransferase